MKKLAIILSVLVMSAVASAELETCYSYKESNEKTVTLRISEEIVNISYGEFFDFAHCKTVAANTLACEHNALRRNAAGEIQYYTQTGKAILDTSGAMVIELGRTPTISTFGMTKITHQHAEFDSEAKKIFSELQNVSRKPLTELSECPANPNAEQ